MEEPKTESTRPAYMLSIIRVLLASGGAARPKAVYSAIEARGERRFPVLADDVDPQVHFENAVRFARQELADGGILTRTLGVWTLAAPEVARELTHKDATRIIGDNRRERERRRAAKQKERADLKVEFGANLRVLSSEQRRQVGVPTLGPKPSSYEASFRREDGAASTYIFRFARSNIWKIGYAGHVSKRLDHVNQHVPLELLGEGWEIARSARWPSQSIAYGMEQALLGLLSAERTMFERVNCAEERIFAAWDQALNDTKSQTYREKVEV